MFKKNKSPKTDVAIIQPAVPNYRVDFFTEVGKKIKIKLYTTKKDFLDVKSVENFQNTYYQPNFKKIGPFLWHNELPLRHILNTHSQIVINGNLRIVNYMIILILARLMGKEVIWWGHLNTAGSYGLSSKVRQKIMRISSKILLYTELEKERFHHKDQVYALNNGLTPPQEIKIKKIQDVSSSHSFNLLFIRSLTEKCNILPALQQLFEAEFPFEFHIIGDGPLMTNCSKFLNDPRFIFHGALFQENDICAVARQCELLVYPGSVGLSLIKGFGYGLPAVIHSNMRNHMPEFAAAVENKNVLFFTENDYQSLINSIQYYRSMPSDKKLELHVNALNTVQETYNTEDMVSRMIDCLNG